MIMIMMAAPARAEPVVLDAVPSYVWYHGCGPTAAASILGYYDASGLAGLFDADGTALYLTDNVREEISSTAHNAKYDPTPDDQNLPVPPYTSIADWFRTSVDPRAYGWSYVSHSTDAFEGYAAYRGYAFAARYASYSVGAFAWNDLTTEIDAGRPVLLLVDRDADGATDHFVAALGYDDRGDGDRRYACYDGYTEAESVVWQPFRGVGQAWGIGFATLVTPPNHWRGGVADWFDPDMWFAGVPQAGQTAYIDNAGVAVLSAGSGQAGTLLVGNAAIGGISQEGGSTSIGTLTLGARAGSVGTYDLSGGSLCVGELLVGPVGRGTLNLAPPGDLLVTASLVLGPGARLSAQPGSSIRVAGPAVEIQSADPDALAGLGELTLILEAGADVTTDLEAAGADLGADPAAWSGNFALAELVLGGAAPGRLRLVDESDNHPGQSGSEAVYVRNLSLNAGAAVELDGLNLYYLNDGPPKRLIPGDANLDGAVDVQDLSILATNWEISTADWAMGDYTGDGNVGVQDLSVLATNWGSGLGATLPEPATALLLVPGGTLLGLVRRRGGSSHPGGGDIATRRSCPAADGRAP